MARGHWRNWEETNCKGCGSLIYKKYGKKNKGEFYCVSCWERIKTHKGWHENKNPYTGKAPKHQAAATSVSLANTLRVPMVQPYNPEIEDIEKKIDTAENIERAMGRDYPRALTLKNWMELLQVEKKSSKIMILTEEIDHYVKLGLGWGANDPQELQDAIKAVYDYAIEKRKDVAPRVDVKPINEIIEYFSQFQSEPYVTIKKGFIMLKEQLEKPWLFGLYEETQFRTPKQEINWEIKLAKTRMKRDTFGLSPNIEKRLNTLKEYYNG